MSEELQKRLMEIYLLLQEVTHQVDAIQDLSGYKHDLKAKTNGFIKYIEPKLNVALSAADNEEKESYQVFVQEITDLAESQIKRMEIG